MYSNTQPRHSTLEETSRMQIVAFIDTSTLYPKINSLGTDEAGSFSQLYLRLAFLSSVWNVFLSIFVGSKNYSFPWRRVNFSPLLSLVHKLCFHFKLLHCWLTSLCLPQLPRSFSGVKIGSCFLSKSQRLMVSTYLSMYTPVW